MKYLLLLLFTFSPFHLFTFSQERKPCGTSVLARRHVAEEGSAARARFKNAPQQKAYLGEKRGLIILVEFADTKFQDEDPFQTWNDIANFRGYAEHSAPGCVSDYFHAQSYGQFDLVFDVVGPIEAQHEHAYYGENIDWGDPTGWFDKNVGELVEEACRAVSNQVQFKDYDWNDDGEVDQVFLLYAGHGENDYSRQDSTVIWPHMATLIEDWDYKDGLVLQDMVINTYACGNEINRSGQLEGLGTFCHEFSHCLGLPDLYDTEHGRSIVGSYDLMDQGCYNGRGWCPVGYSSYERYACGWLTPAEIDNPYDVKGSDPDNELTRGLGFRAIKPLIRYPDAYIWRSSPGANDYYLIEYRLRESWDAKLPMDGVMAWHIDYDEKAWEENTVNKDPKHLRVERMTLDYMKATGIVSVLRDDSDEPCAVYDLNGRPSLRIIKYSDGSTKKVFR